MYQCQNPDHNQAPKTNFCFNENCQSKRLFCTHCLTQQHFSHVKDVIILVPYSKKSKLQILVKNSDFDQQYIQQFKNYIQILQKQVREKKKKVLKSLRIYEDMFYKQFQRPLLAIQQSFSIGTVQQIVKRILHVDKSKQKQELQQIAKQILNLQSQPKRSSNQMKNYLFAIKKQIHQNIDQSLKIFEQNFDKILEPLEKIDIWKIQQQKLKTGNLEEQIPPVSWAFGRNSNINQLGEQSSNHFHSYNVKMQQPEPSLPKYFELPHQIQIDDVSSEISQSQIEDSNKKPTDLLRQCVMHPQRQLQRSLKSQKRIQDKERKMKNVSQGLSKWGKCAKLGSAYLSIQQWLSKCKKIGWLKNISVPILRTQGQRVTDIPSEICHLKKLNHLVLVDYNVSCIQNLAACISLKELHLSHNRIKKIENLQKLINLQTIILCSNQIQQIENLDNNINLKAINLNLNKIKKIQRIKQLVNLRFLVLSNNRIDCIEDQNLFPVLQIPESSLRIFLDNNLIKKSTILRALIQKGIYIDFEGSYICQCLSQMYR